MDDHILAVQGFCKPLARAQIGLDCFHARRQMPGARGSPSEAGDLRSGFQQLRQQMPPHKTSAARKQHFFTRQMWRIYGAFSHGHD